MQGERECICRFCKKLLNPPEGKRVLVVSVFYRVKNKELTAALVKRVWFWLPKLKKLGHCLYRENFLSVLPLSFEEDR